MPPQIYPTPFDALFDVFDGAVILVGGFGHVGHPHNLVRALRDRGVKNLTIVANNIGLGDSLDLLAETGQIKKFIGSFPVRASRERMTHFERLFREGLAEVEITPQGTMVERIRAAGAGIAAFYTPVGVGTIVEQGKEIGLEPSIDGRTVLQGSCSHLPRAAFAILDDFLRPHSCQPDCLAFCSRLL